MTIVNNKAFSRNKRDNQQSKTASSIVKSKANVQGTAKDMNVCTKVIILTIQKQVLVTQ